MQAGVLSSLPREAPLGDGDASRNATRMPFYRPVPPPSNDPENGRALAVFFGVGFVQHRANCGGRKRKAHPGQKGGPERAGSRFLGFSAEHSREARERTTPTPGCPLGRRAISGPSPLAPPIPETPLVCRPLNRAGCLVLGPSFWAWDRFRMRAFARPSPLREPRREQPGRFRTPLQPER